MRLRMGERWVNTGYCFTRENGEPMHPDSITSWLNKFSKKYGLPHINPHKFRHTQASILINEGVDVVTVAKRLGHKQVTTTEISMLMRWPKLTPKQMLSLRLYCSKRKRR